MPVKVLTNHKGLEYFMTTKKLTPRQARWAEFLSEFNFKVMYQTGKKNDKADALTRKLNKRPANEEDEQQKYRMQVLLPPECINIQPIEVTDEPEDKGVEAERADEEEINKPRTEPERPRVAEPPAEPQPAEEKVEDENALAEKLAKSHAAELHIKPEEATGKTLPERVKKLNQNNVLFTEICEYLGDPVGHE